MGEVAQKNTSSKYVAQAVPHQMMTLESDVDFSVSEESPASDLEAGAHDVRTASGLLQPEQFYQKKVVCTEEETWKLEEATHTQGASSKWHAAHQVRLHQL